MMKLKAEFGQDCEPRLSIELLDFEHYPDFNVIYLFCVNIWVVYFMITLDFGDG